MAVVVGMGMDKGTAVGMAGTYSPRLPPRNPFLVLVSLFLILMFGLAYIDGQVSDSEKEQIASFAAQNFDSDNSDFEAVATLMIEADGKEMLQYMLVAAAYIGANVSAESKKTMLTFLIDLAKSDGEVHDNELSLITQLKDAWL